MIRLSNLSLAPGQETKLKSAAAAMLRIPESRILSFALRRRSIDARKRPDVRIIYTVDVAVQGNESAVLARANCPNAALALPEEPYRIPDLINEPALRPVVVGFGPAGMFASLALARAGLRPIVLERGSCIEKRSEKVQAFFSGGSLDLECNVQFGEGGAGTFSDGKLNTGTHDPRIRYVLEQFAAFGAGQDVCIDARPHVGTDVLRDVVRNLRSEVLSLGGEILFDTRMDALHVEGGRLTGIETSGRLFPCSHAILALGHSARDSFRMLQRSGLPMEPKAFSLGVRIEHLQSAVDLAQYGRPRGKDLPPADYRLSVHLPDGSSAYTFCMCPGGYVVAAASEEGGVVTNGMSYSGRAGKNANSALLVSVTPADFPPGEDPLRGMEWQRSIEQRAFLAAGGTYRAPAQTVGDFLSVPAVSPVVETTYLPGTVPADLHEILPEQVCSVLEQALPLLGRKLKGFDAPEAVMTAPETRSSSPVRILRDKLLQSPAAFGLYPCGEGAGYAGGIVSSAVDGLRCAEALIQSVNSTDISS